MSAPFSQARRLYDRAQVQLVEFNRLRRSPWSITVHFNHASQDYVYRLTLDRQAFDDLDLLGADTASDLAHALDHLVAAWARMGGSRRLRIHYPVMMDETAFTAALTTLETVLPPAAIAAIRQVRRDRRSVLEHMDLIKKVSNSGKHWSFVGADVVAHGVGVTHPGGLIDPGQREIAAVPVDHFLTHDTFDFARTRTPPAGPLGYEILSGVTFSGLDSAIVVDPSTAFQCASRFVLAAIEAAEASVSAEIA